MPNLNWSEISPLQLGKYAEYYSKMEFTSYKFDVYTPEIDDHGVDFICKHSNSPLYYEIQVKGSCKGKYVFVPKEKMPLSENRILCLLNFIDGKLPDMYLIPSLEWEHPDSALVYRSYDKPNQKSKPEYGINLSLKNLQMLEKYRAENFFNKF